MIPGFDPMKGIPLRVLYLHVFFTVNISVSIVRYRQRVKERLGLLCSLNSAQDIVAAGVDDDINTHILTLSHLLLSHTTCGNMQS